LIFGLEIVFIRLKFSIHKLATLKTQAVLKLLELLPSLMDTVMMDLVVESIFLIHSSGQRLTCMVLLIALELLLARQFPLLAAPTLMQLPLMMPWYITLTTPFPMLALLSPISLLDLEL
jgi:hypothetical protein